MDNPILRVENIGVSFDNENAKQIITKDVGFELCKRDTLGIVGESGCGKSLTALAIMRLLPKPSANIENGKILFRGLDIAKLPAKKLQKIRGNRISMIFQEPMTALNPVHKIGKQIGEVFKLHKPDMTKKEIGREAVKLLEQVGISDPERRIEEYPHQISGGMRQRVMIAIAIALKPDILIADEPTTALDVTIQSQILALIKELQNKTDMAVIFISHDLGVIAEICNKVVVMYAGRVVEKGLINNIFYNPRHPYTKGLLSSVIGLESIRKTELKTIKGMVPEFGSQLSGCRFANRCHDVVDICKKKSPEETIVGDEHFASCHNL